MTMRMVRFCGRISELGLLMVMVIHRFLLRGASPVNGAKNRYFFLIIIRLHMHAEIRM